MKEDGDGDVNIRSWVYALGCERGERGLRQRSSGGGPRWLREMNEMATLISELGFGLGIWVMNYGGDKIVESRSAGIFCFGSKINYF